MSTLYEFLWAMWRFRLTLLDLLPAFLGHHLPPHFPHSPFLLQMAGLSMGPPPPQPPSSSSAPFMGGPPPNSTIPKPSMPQYAPQGIPNSKMGSPNSHPNYPPAPNMTGPPQHNFPVQNLQFGPPISQQTTAPPNEFISAPTQPPTGGLHVQCRVKPSVT